jgi:hypothetical protein
MDLLSHPARLPHPTFPPQLSQGGSVGDNSRRQDILHACVGWLTVHSIGPCFYRGEFVSV